MEKLVKRDFRVLREVISPENVQVMSELIALSLTKHFIKYIGAPMEKMHKALYCDVMHFYDSGYTVSDAYDLVQTGALFLCEHYGERLDDIVGYNKRNKAITLEILCERQMERLINDKFNPLHNHKSFEALQAWEEPKAEIRDCEADYTVFDSIVNSLNLTENMRIALHCRMAGMSYPEIGRILERAQSTVYEYFIKMRQRYIAIYGNNY